MAAIFLPSINRSPRTRSPTFSSMLTMVPPLSRMRFLGSSGPSCPKRLRSCAPAASERTAAAPAAKIVPAFKAPRRETLVSLFMESSPAFSCRAPSLP